MIQEREYETDSNQDDEQAIASIVENLYPGLKLVKNNNGLNIDRSVIFNGQTIGTAELKARTENSRYFIERGGIMLDLIKWENLRRYSGWFIFSIGKITVDNVFQVVADREYRWQYGGRAERNPRKVIYVPWSDVRRIVDFM